MCVCVCEQQMLTHVKIHGTGEEGKHPDRQARSHSDMMSMRCALQREKGRRPNVSISQSGCLQSMNVACCSLGGVETVACFKECTPGVGFEQITLPLITS